MVEFNFKVLLAEAGITQQEYANIIGVSKQAVNSWVKKGKMPGSLRRYNDLITLMELANANCGRYDKDLEKLYIAKGVHY